MTLSQFTDAVDHFRLLTGASATSWFRTVTRNHEIGGVTHSAHLVGLAVDVVYDDPVPLTERKEWARRLGLKLIEEDDHDHLQPDTWEAG